MKGFLYIILMSCILSSTAVIILNGINRTLEILNSHFYWEAIGIGYLIAITIYLYRYRKGYIFPTNNTVIWITVACPVVAALGFPTTAGMLQVEQLREVSHFLSWAMPLSALIVISCAGFCGVKPSNLAPKLISKSA